MEGKEYLQNKSVEILSNQIKAVSSARGVACDPETVTYKTAKFNLLISNIRLRKPCVWSQITAKETEIIWLISNFRLREPPKRHKLYPIDWTLIKLTL